LAFLSDIVNLNTQPILWYQYKRFSHSCSYTIACSCLQYHAQTQPLGIRKTHLPSCWRQKMFNLNFGLSCHFGYLTNICSTFCRNCRISSQGCGLGVVKSRRFWMSSESDS